MKHVKERFEAFSIRKVLSKRIFYGRYLLITLKERLIWSHKAEPDFAQKRQYLDKFLIIPVNGMESRQSLDYAICLWRQAERSEPLTYLPRGAGSSSVGSTLMAWLVERSIGFKPLSKRFKVMCVFGCIISKHTNKIKTRELENFSTVRSRC